MTTTPTPDPLDAIISNLRSEIEWCIDPQRLSGVTVDRERATKAEQKAKTALTAHIKTEIDKARIEFAESLKRYDWQLEDSINANDVVCQTIDDELTRQTAMEDTGGTN